MERIEHFCDRCGCKLEEHKRILRFVEKDWSVKMEVSTDDFLPDVPSALEIAEKAKEVAKKEHDYMIIRLWGWRRDKTLELCGKCRSDFEEFMKNA